jgi:hypothetical protein
LLWRLLLLFLLSGLLVALLLATLSWILLLLTRLLILLTALVLLATLVWITHVITSDRSSKLVGTAPADDAMSVLLHLANSQNKSWCVQPGTLTLLCARCPLEASHPLMTQIDFYGLTTFAGRPSPGSIIRPTA